MLAKEIVPNVYAVSLGFVNVFLLDAEELTLIDTGIPGSEKKILEAIAELGYKMQDLRHILITHLHYDHTGSLEKIKNASGATTYMHELDASSYLTGEVMRLVEPSPGLITQLIVKNMNKRPSLSADHLVKIDQLISTDGEITGTGGLQAIHSPGHTAGHIAYFWPKQNGVLFAGDAASNMLHLGYSILYESFSKGQETLVRLGQIQFNTACFSHGKTIQSGASDRFKKTFHQ